jgi:thiol:disulfide interchange protein
VNFLRLIPVFVSFLLLGAHFMRAGQNLVLLGLGLLLLLLFLRKWWVPRLLQFVLLLGAVEWIVTAVTLAQVRMQLGQPWARMAVILGAVALFTLLAGLVFQLPALRQRYAKGAIARKATGDR